MVRSIHAPRSLRSSLPEGGRVHGARRHAGGSARGAEACEVLPPLVDPRFRPAENREALRTELGLKGAPLMGMVSTFQPSRRHSLGVAAFAQLLRTRPEARLVLVGDGALLEQVRQQVTELGLEERVTFAGLSVRETPS